MSEPYIPPFHLRYAREIKQTVIGVAAISFGVAYHHSSDIRRISDKAFNPAVAGISQAYSFCSTFIYQNTGMDFGLVAVPSDQDFLFGVRLATYINQRRAGPLLDIAADSRFPEDKRERALLALLKFDTTADWIQPFLNELPKGGLLGLYDEKTPVLDALISRIREEGGVRQPLVRAYAEVVFSFMLQHPDQIIRLHANKWVSDVVAEDALFLMIPRFAKEKDPKVQEAIESALYGIRAVSEPGTAKELILPFYNSPQWPWLKRPLAVILARLGYGGAVEYVNTTLNNPNLTEELRLAFNLAASRTPYPRVLGISDDLRAIAMERERMREREVQAALARRQRLVQQERLKKILLSQADQEKNNLERAAREAAEAEALATKARQEAQAQEARLAAQKAAAAKAEKEAARKAQEREAAAIRARKEAEAKAAGNQKASEAKAAALAAKKAAEAEAAAIAARKAAEREAKARAIREAEEAKAAALAAKRAAEAEAAAAAARKAAEQRSAEAAHKVLPPAMKPPVAFPIDQATEPATPTTAASKPAEQLASLPPEEDILPPALESVVPKSKSLMNYVDLVIQVKKEPAPLFQNPGDTPTGTSLPPESKGRADFEVLIGEDKWYQVKSKKGTGWVNGKYLSVFNLSPGSEAPVANTPPPPSQIEGGRKESTYFEASVEGAPLFEKPSESSKKVGTLTEATPYLAVRSEKVGANRWFLLQIRAGETAWARGLDLQLADVQQPNVLEIPTQSLSQRGKQSAFKAEWITAAVKGVGVYSRPSIVAKMVNQINPNAVFKVVEAQSAGGYEWYRIELGPNADGWVQTMDVKLTKAPK